MGVPVQTADVAECISRGTVSAAGSSVVNPVGVYHFYKVSGSIASNPLHIEAAFQANVMLPLLLAINHRYTQQFNTVRIINDVTNAAVQVTRAIAGSIAGDSYPPDVTAFFLMRTAFRGKSFRGNKRMGPVSESDTTTGTDDTFNAGALTRLRAAAASILAGFTDSDGNVWAPCVLSKKLSLLKTNPTTIYAPPCTAILVNTRLGRQDRRQVKSAY